jgi:ribonuclease J
MADSNDELVFLPLGGVGEIGMNLALYGIGPRRQSKTWMAVDCGVSFAGDDLPGVNLIMPDIAFLAERRQNLVGIVLTHAHEDHFGALFDLWPRLKVPVYATPFTAALIEAKRLSEPGAPEIDVKIMPLQSRFALGPFDVEFVNVAHSIPESNALIIRTPHGTVLHTGDWKLDPTPVIGAPTDEARLRALGAEGCLAMIGDSTNAVRAGRSPSEREVAATLATLIESAPARVAVTTFASNVARIKAVADAARRAGREVVIVGRAMVRMVQVARETGYLEGVPQFRPIEAYGYLPPDKVVAICTGSQGELRAALSRIATDDHPELTFSRGDRVIFSSRAIPGNEKAVARVINGLVRQGIEVITDRTHLVHVSGHPRIDEVAEMYSWVRPQIAVPVHGEPLHLSEHARIARAAGVKDVIFCEDGDVIRLAPKPHGKVDHVPSGRVYKDGFVVVPGAEPAIGDRRKLSFSGMISVALALDDRGEIADGPEFELVGIPEFNAQGLRMDALVEEAMMSAFGSLPRARRRDPDTVAEAMRRAVRAAVAQNWGKKPICLVHVLTV